MSTAHLPETLSGAPASAPSLSRRTMLAGTGLTLALSSLLVACGPAQERIQPTANGGKHTNEAQDVDINQVLSQLEAEHGITLSLAVYNHSADNLFLHRGDQWTYEASIVKVPISLTLLRLAAFEKRLLTDEEKALIEASITYSDNNATIEIYSRFGSNKGESTASAESLNKTYELLGLTETRTAGNWGDNQTWAEDQVCIMRAIVDTVEWVNAADAQFLLEKMVPLDWSQAWGVGSQHGQLVAGEPVTDVSVKNGWIQEDTGAWHINSVGVVRTESSTYSIALLGKGFADQQVGYEVASQAVQAYFDHAG
ncbi:MAG: serine hydrolase [Rothia sp. (in: high G+C Gram-positive bacteria)]|nr:serine hydrolase [Rothia sp. (in: high G+C Gram-positive bacteria)]